MKEEQILEELKEIRQELSYIKSHIHDLDLVLTDDDSDSIREAKKELKEKKTKRLI